MRGQEIAKCDLLDRGRRGGQNRGMNATDYDTVYLSSDQMNLLRMRGLADFPKHIDIPSLRTYCSQVGIAVEVEEDREEYESLDGRKVSVVTEKRVRLVYRI